MSPSGPLARAGADVIRRGYERYRAQFQEITRRARRRFEERDWLAGQRDSVERNDVRREVLSQVLDELGAALLVRIEDRATWSAIKAEYAVCIRGWSDVEIAETFFNSVTRLVFTTVGVDTDVEFVGGVFERASLLSGSTIHRTFTRTTTTRALLERILLQFRFSVPYRDLAGDAELAARRIDDAWREAFREEALETILLVDSIFYRGSAAYLVGRLRGGDASLPLVVALVHHEGGVEVDAVLTSEDEVSVVFSYTRSYFHVEIACPSRVVRLLSSLLPRKPIADLYISLGYNKHGKTEMYRSVLSHLAHTRERFEHAPGETGMVMLVFAMPSFEYVFKVIRDRFAYPKTSTREDVLAAYQLVFHHDRAGRLVDAQEFEHLSFDGNRFEPRLLEELLREAPSSVALSGRQITIKHLYIERRVRPLNLYLRENGAADAWRALDDYGQAIRDLAQTNIFPGDLLLKNFGVTRHGRVIFYDYDELCHVTDCHFRDLPRARHGDEELAAEPWFYVGEDDVFPEEFIGFLGLSAEQRARFRSAHGEILTAEFWRRLQGRIRAGEVLDTFPYPPTRRLRTAAP